MDLDKAITLVTAGVAVWGAITGSVAIALQYLQHRKDKTDLKLTPKMSIRTSIDGTILDAMELIDFEVEVVNVGRRVARIDEVGISVKGRGKPQSENGLNVIVFDSKINGVETLEEGEKRVFELRRWQKTLQDLAEHFDDKETAYVRLTSGKQFRADFRTVSMSKLAELRKKA